MSLRVAILGATGLIGREIAETLAERGFPATSVAALAQRKSQGKEISMGDAVLRALDVDRFDWSEADVCFLAAGERAARKWAPRITTAGCIAIDVSPAFRMDPAVPLVAPEANLEAIDGWSPRRILATPSAAAAQLVAVLKPLDAAVGVRRVLLTALLSASGMGRRAMDELFQQTKGVFVGQAPEPKEFAKQIAFNLIPQAGDYLDDGSTDAETAVVQELRKMLGSQIEAVATCVLAPVFVGDALAVHVELERPLAASAARALLRQSPGLMVIDNREEEALATPVDAVGEWAVFVSRIREHDALPNGLAFWIVSDNLRKGAALNAVQIAEALLARGAFQRTLGG